MVAKEILDVSIEGMTCNSCVDSIRSALQQQIGVEDVSISLSEGTGQVGFVPLLATKEQIVEVIEDAGFTAAVLDNSQSVEQNYPTVYIGVEGMVCMSCVNTIEGQMRTMKGVQSINVSLESHTATVTYDPSLTDPQSLCNAIDDMGFDAREKKDSNGRNDGPSHIVMNITESIDQSDAATIEDAVNKLNGIDQVTVSIHNRTATVFHRPSQSSVDSITHLVSNLGYTVTVVSKEYEHAIVGIEGMTCQSCVSAINNVLQDLEGLVSYKVLLDDERALVSFNPLVTTIKDIIITIEDCGFDAKELKDDSDTSFEKNGDAVSVGYKTSSSKEPVKTMAKSQFSNYSRPNLKPNVADDEPVEKAFFQVTGMSCASCVGKIEREIGKSKGRL